MEYIANETASMFINDEFKTFILPVSVVFGLFSAVGILGNLFVLYVHLFKYKQCNFRYFVLGLCAVDLTSSVTILPLEIFTQLNWYVFPSQSLCKIKAFMNAFTSVASVYVLLLISIDRHRKVCAPYGWQMTDFSVLKGYGLFLFLTCVQCWPVIIIWGLQPGIKTYRNTVVYVTVCSRDPAVKDTIWPKVFVISMCPHFIAMFVMLVLYVLVGRQIFGVVRTLKRQSKKQSPKSALKKRSTHSQNKTAYINPKISVGGLSSSDEQLHDMMHDEHGAVGTCKPNSFNDNTTQAQETNEPRPAMKQSFSKKLRKVSSDSRDISSNDMELVIYEVEDHGICVKKSKIAKASNKKKRKLKPRQTESSIKKPNYTDSLKRSVRFSVSSKDKLRRRTLITFVFTAIFISTTIMYIIFSFRVANDNATQSLSFRQLAAFLFVYRLYFINSVIHPILYGVLDPRFRKTLKTASRMVIESVIRRSVHEPENKPEH